MIGFLARRTLPRASTQLARVQAFPISSRFFQRSSSLTSRWISSTAPTAASVSSSPVSDKKLSVTATSETTRSDEVRHGLSSRRVVAVCTAAQYDLRKIDELFHGPTRAVHRTLPYVHVVNPLLREEDRSMGQVDIFFFPHGSFVAWGTTPAQDAQILEKLASLRGPAQHAAAEREEYTYFVSNNNQNDIDIKRDALVLAAEDAHIKVAFSFGLAGSVKLNVLEEAVDHLMSMTPVMITKHTLAESQIERQLNQLYEVRKANLTILDLPDYFWEHPQHEKVLEMAHTYCMTRSRIKILNEKVEQVKDVIHVKMDDLRHKHSIRLERIIVALILIEVTFGCVDHADQIAALARSLMS